MVLPWVFSDDGLCDKADMSAYKGLFSDDVKPTNLGAWVPMYHWGTNPRLKPLNADKAVEAAVRANKRVTGKSIKKWFFALESGGSLEHEGASAVLSYIARYPREKRFHGAADIIFGELRIRGGSSYPLKLVNLVVDALPGVGSGYFSDRIQVAYRGAAMYALRDLGMKAKEAAPMVSDAFRVKGGRSEGNARTAPPALRKPTPTSAGMTANSCGNCRGVPR